MTIAVDWDVKHLFKQNKQSEIQRAGALRYKYFRLSVISLSYHIIPMEKSHYARFFFHFYTCMIQIVHIINVHVNHDLYTVLGTDES